MGRRIVSIDVLRGFDMFFLMGVNTLVVRFCAACGWGADCWLARQMSHPQWMGFTHRDTIFPLFIFIAGLSFPFSKARQQEEGRTRTQMALRVVRRMAMLFLLGMLYEYFFQGQPFRFGSVLGRIGLAWGCAAGMQLFLGVRVRIAIAVGMLLGYWALLLSVPAPGFTLADVLSPQGNISCWIDRTFLAPLGRISPGSAELPFETQGLLGNLPAIVTAMLGMFTGEFLRTWRGRLSGDRLAASLLAAAFFLAVAGLLIAHGFGRWSFPLSKPLWSPSFVLLTGGYSAALFAAFYWLIDVKGLWRRTLFFRVIGMNAIAFYIAKPLLNLQHANEMLFGRLTSMFPTPWSDVALSIAFVGTCWGLLYFLYRRQLFFKI